MNGIKGEKVLQSSNDKCHHAQRLQALIEDIDRRLNQACQSYQILYCDALYVEKNDDHYLEEKSKRKRGDRQQTLRDLIFWKGQYFKVLKDKGKTDKY